MTEQASILFWDTSLVGDEGVTAELVPFPGSGNIAGWKGLEPLPVPERIYFETNARTARRVDYPDNDCSWPIMSQRMRDVLLPHTAKHRVIPVTFLDDTIDPAERFDGEKPRPGAAIEGFAAVQILERTDAMDMTASSFTPDEDFPGMAHDVAKLVLRPVELPWLFRLASYPYPLFVSAEGRTALEKADIKGVKFFPLARLAFM
jgi:hypothetical protein